MAANCKNDSYSEIDYQAMLDSLYQDQNSLILLFDHFLSIVSNFKSSNF